MFIDLTRAPVLRQLTQSGNARVALVRVVTGVAVLGLLSLPVVGTGGLPGFCLVNRLMGVPCPFCGVTRSCGLALHGRFVESFHRHPAGLLVVGALCAQVVVYGARLSRRPAATAALRTIESRVNGLIVAVCVGHWFVVVLPSLVRR